MCLIILKLMLQRKNPTVFVFLETLTLFLYYLYLSDWLILEEVIYISIILQFFNVLKLNISWLELTNKYLLKRQTKVYRLKKLAVVSVIIYVLIGNNSSASTWLVSISSFWVDLSIIFFSSGLMKMHQDSFLWNMQHVSRNGLPYRQVSSV